MKNKQIAKINQEDIAHNLNVAARGETIKINNIDFNVDLIKPAAHSAIIIDLYNQIKIKAYALYNDISPQITLEHQINIFTSLVSENESFKNKMLLILLDLTKNQEVYNLKLQDLVGLAIHAIFINKEEIGKKQVAVETANLAAMNIILQRMQKKVPK